LISPFF